ncbi:unnamed protein product [Nezara viridula]|uniref:Uncharacterized protein n=1 Tax=Nezara viridula TaxID=85310 RepID=A0A9P0MSI8_NEZVI|nr:unnamed protein product [Nezara viridula]
MLWTERHQLKIEHFRWNGAETRNHRNCHRCKESTRRPTKREGGEEIKCKTDGPWRRQRGKKKKSITEEYKSRLMQVHTVMCGKRRVSLVKNSWR